MAQAAGRWEESAHLSAKQCECEGHGAGTAQKGHRLMIMERLSPVPQGLFAHRQPMPELPEVEVTRRSFAGRIAGSTVMSATLGKPLRWPLGCPPTRLAGRTVVTVDRRGKYLILCLDRGVLLIHLGMSGSLLFGSDLEPPSKHDHFCMQTSAGTLRLRDPRRFGAVVFAESMDDPVVTRLLGRLGAEPLSDDFDVDSFVTQMSRRRMAVKQVLLAGDVVVGVGNIYACEVLFLSGIAPTSSPSTLEPGRLRLLHAAIRQVLAQAVAQGGSTLRDFSNAYGQEGHFQSHAHVYGREGLPCLRCGVSVTRIQQGQRSTYFCAVCQTA